MTAFAAALSMAVPGMAQAPAAKAEQAKSSTKKKAVEAVPARTEKEIADAKKSGITLAVVADEVGVASDMAWHSGTYVVKDKGGKTVDAGKFLEAWQRKNGMWRIARDIWNSDGAAPAAPATPPTPEPKKK